MSDFYDKKQLDEAQAKIRENATPQQLKMLEDADAAFDEVQDEFVQRQSEEDKLRRWAFNLCGFNLDMSEIEHLRDVAKMLTPGTTTTFLAKRGVTQLFKTAFGTLDRVDRYLQTLERTVIDITNNSQFTPLSFCDLIKLAFKRLLKRNQR
jgi:hypothetical protein